MEGKTRITTIKGVARPSASGNECLVVIYGDQLGRKYDLGNGDITIGRDPSNTIVLNVDSVSRYHARIEDHNSVKTLVDLNSTNGTYLNDVLAVREPLQCGDFVKVGDSIFKFLSGDNIESAYHEEIYTMTVTDGLTQVPNKRYLVEHLEREFARARRYGRNLSAVMMDIDFFKRINDEFGHLTGDYVLKELASVVRPRIRREEVFARYGGEEFCAILPECDPQGVHEFAETIRRLVENHTFEFEGNSVDVTVSLGVGHLTEDMESPLQLLKSADDNLYAAKRAGRNQVCG